MGLLCDRALRVLCMCLPGWAEVFIYMYIYIVAIRALARRARHPNASSPPILMRGIVNTVEVYGSRTLYYVCSMTFTVRSGSHRHWHRHWCPIL